MLLPATIGVIWVVQKQSRPVHHLDSRQNFRITTVFLFVSGLGNLLYLVYDTKTGKLQPEPQTPASFFTNWPKNKPNWNHSLKAVLVNWWEGGQGVVYFFCGAEYLKYDVAMKSVLPGYPKEIEGSPWKSIEWRPTATFDNLV